MDFRRQRLLARLALCAFAAVCAVWLWRLDHRERISTNILDLIPSGERAPEVGLVRGFASNVQSRVMLFALLDPARPAAAPHAAARAFVDELRKAPEFAEVQRPADPAAQDALGREVFAHRLTWLLPTWLAARERAFAATGRPGEQFSAWLAEGAAADLEAFLARPEATAMQDLLPQDPLLLVPSLADRARLLAPGGAGAAGRALVWARLEVSPFAEAGQGPVFAAVERALAAARAVQPGVDLRWSGINRFAAASRARIEAELKGLNLVSIAGVLAVSCLFVRRISRLLHLLPVIALSIVGAWTLSTLVFDRLHVLVFVIGSLLSGVAVDYGFYIYMQPPLYPDETYGQKLRRLLRPLLASCLTTVAGFSLLLFSELPLIRQIGFFVSAGLLCALGAAMLYFAQLDRPQLEGREWGGLGGAGAAPGWRRLVRVGLVAAVLAALLGPWRLQWRDDVRELDLPAPELHANERELRAWFGETDSRSLFLTHGPTLAAARARLDAFLAWHAAARPGVAAASVGLLLPTEDDWRALPQRLARLKGFAADFRAALARHGFTPESFEPFFAAWEAQAARAPAEDFAALAAGLDRALTGPLALLSQRGAAPYWFLSVVDAPDVTAPEGLHTLGLQQLQSLNDLFTRYRWSALRLSLIGLGLVIASVFAIYPAARALRIALIPAGSCFFVFGVLGLAGFTLNLFHLLGAFLGVCLSHNYAIFSADNAERGTAPPAPIRLSALSTVASFGALAFSRIPVIHALGATVALIVLTALAIVELEPLARRPRA